MLWPFNRRGSSRTPSRGTIEAIYGMIVAQAREPLFYQGLGVPDTVNGRFDMVVLHLWMVLRRLRTGAEGPALAQALFDHFCDDMDDNLREMGVSDVGVPKRMKAFGEAFYGRSIAYDQALEAGGPALAAALARNILNSGEGDVAAPLAAYVRRAIAELASLADADLAAGRIRLPLPAASESGA
ncbi:MAG: ubiquinol-cytochrome C chaperone family protein [Pseudomonadota bacterium]|jgi:cytochrome b pre-mRNA-processing protein 3